MIVASHHCLFTVLGQRQGSRPPAAAAAAAAAVEALETLQSLSSQVYKTIISISSNSSTSTSTQQQQAAAFEGGPGWEALCTAAKKGAFLPPT
ncbi:hypothetical protein ACSSS7_008395 [Eimeria intestinalis]